MKRRRERGYMRTCKWERESERVKESKRERTRERLHEKVYKGETETE